MSLAKRYKNWYVVANDKKKNFTDDELHDFWFIKGCKSLDLTDDEINEIFRLSRKYEKLQLLCCNEPMTDKEYEKNEKALDRVIERTIELTEEHNKRSKKKILIAHYSIYPLRIYSLTDWTRETKKRYSRKKFFEIHEWLFCHRNHVVYFE